MGGNAMKLMGVTPIAANDIVDTICKVSKLTGIPFSSFTILGSAGKKPYSNDLDLAINSNTYSSDNIHSKLVTLLGENKAVFNHGTGVGSYAIQNNGHYVQVDLMFTPSIEWAKFAYYAPSPNESEYKGAVRTMLLMGVASMINEEGYDWFHSVDVDGTEQLVVRVGRTFDLNNGIRRIYQYRPQRKDGKGYVKAMKSVTLEELQEMFPSIDVAQDDLVITDPREALHLMFKHSVSPEEVSTAERVINLIDTIFVYDFADQIYQNTANRAKSVKDKIKLPPEISQFL